MFDFYIQHGYHPRDRRDVGKADRRQSDFGRALFTMDGQTAKQLELHSFRSHWAAKYLTDHI